MRENYLLYYFQ